MSPKDVDVSFLNGESCLISCCSMIELRCRISTVMSSLPPEVAILSKGHVLPDSAAIPTQVQAIVCAESERESCLRNAFRAFAAVGDMHGVDRCSRELTREFDEEFSAQALRDSCTSGDADVVTTLIDQSSSLVNSKSNIRETPLLLAVLNNHAHIVEKLLASSATVQDSREGETPLHVAARGGNKDIVRMLLAVSDANARCPYGFTPMHWAAWFNDSTDIMEMLLEHGMGEQSNGGDTPLHLAAERGFEEMVVLLLKHGAKDIPGVMGYTPLHRAASRGKHAIVELLMGNGLDAVTVEGDTPLHLAARNGFPDVVRALCRQTINVNAQNYDGDSALHLAAYHGHAEVAQILLEHDAVVVANKSGDTPLAMATKQSCGHSDVVKLLRQGSK